MADSDVSVAGEMPLLSSALCTPVSQEEQGFCLNVGRTHDQCGFLSLKMSLLHVFSEKTDLVCKILKQFSFKSIVDFHNVFL